MNECELDQYGGRRVTPDLYATGDWRTYKMNHHPRRRARRASRRMHPLALRLAFLAFAVGAVLAGIVLFAANVVADVARDRYVYLPMVSQEITAIGDSHIEERP